MLLICCTTREIALTNQNHYPNLVSETSSVWSFCPCSSEVIPWENQWWHHKMSLNCWLFSQVNLLTILLLTVITSLAYCSYHHTLYKAAFTLGAQIQYSLRINVNEPFFQVPALEFGHGAGAQVQGQDQKWAQTPCMHTFSVSSRTVNCFFTRC